ncbi:MAG: hypothetical protein HPY60_05750 [Candidatus Methanofastidiosum sp.]|nr:hypothetical protein [Methanofastidiosum sp.]
MLLFSYWEKSGTVKHEDIIHDIYYDDTDIQEYLEYTSNYPVSHTCLDYPMITNEDREKKFLEDLRACAKDKRFQYLDLNNAVLVYENLDALNLGPKTPMERLFFLKGFHLAMLESFDIASNGQQPTSIELVTLDWEINQLARVSIILLELIYEKIFTPVLKIVHKDGDGWHHVHRTISKDKAVDFLFRNSPIIYRNQKVPKTILTLSLRLNYPLIDELAQKIYLKEVVFLKDAPSFYGDDLKVYGPYKQGDIGKIPKRTYEILIENAVVKDAVSGPKTLMDWALTYYDAGLNILPLVPRDKFPIIKWERYEKERARREDVISWWTKQPEANIGIITGEINDLVVVDVDGEQGKRSLEILYNKEMPLTAVTKSTRGKHYYFKNTDRWGSHIGIYPDIDIRGEGGLIVAPPSIHPSGKEYRWINHILETEIAEMPNELVEAFKEKLRSKPNIFEGKIKQGERNKALTSISGSLRNIGLDPEHVRATLLAINQVRMQEPLPEKEVSKITTDFQKSFFTLSDMGNAERMVKYYGETIRYCSPLGRWYIWNGERWEEDSIKKIKLIAMEVARFIFSEASMEPYLENQRKLSNWALTSQMEPRLNAMVNATMAMVPITPDDLDKDLFLLNVRNGTINLKTMEFDETHSKDSYITKIVDVVYDSEAKCPLWENFLHEIFEGDMELISYIQELVGYSLTGDTSEQILIFLYGGGQNGKSTFMNVLKGLLDDYAKQTDFSTFTVRKNDSGPRNDLARLKGSRLVSTIEIEEGKQLAESLVKQVTGEDTIKARFLYSEDFEFLPNFKVWLVANNKPIIKGGDYAIWRRIRLIPFNVKIPEEKKDKELGKKLKAELPGILNWALEGCRRWQSEGLKTPKSVELATKEYEEEMDPIKEFLEDICTTETLGKTKTGELYQIYEEYCGFVKINPIPNRVFGRRLAQIGIKRSRDHNGRYYDGIEIDNDKLERMRDSFRPNLY